MIVATILSIIAAIGVPNYVSALRIARIGKAKHEVQTIAHAIDTYRGVHGQLPLTLYQVGHGGRKDPWGTLYCYLNYTDGTGDGLAWAIAAGLVNPSAFVQSASGGGGGASVRSSLPRPPQGADAAAEDAARVLVVGVSRTLSPGEFDDLTNAVSGNPRLGLFRGVVVEATRRRDRYMFPLNTDYDLFSLGADAQTAVSLGQTVGLDDVIRANNGGFFGLAGDY